MSRRLCLALIAAASILAHLKGIASPLRDYHYHRQINTAAIARNYHENGLRFLHPQIDWEGPDPGRAATEFPLYMWFVGLLWPLGGLGELWGRLLSVLFSALTGMYLFKFLERKLDREAALYAGILFSLVPLEIYFGRTVQPEALALLSTMASLYHWDMALARGRPWGHWAAATAFAFLAIAHKLPYAYLLLVLAALSWTRLGPSFLRDGRSWAACAAAILGVLSWYHYASAGTYVVPAHGHEFKTLLGYGGRWPFYIQFQFLSRFPELTTTYGGLALAGLGAWELTMRRGKAFFAAWFAAISLYLVAGGHYTFAHEYTSLPFALVNAAFMGIGLYRLRAWISAAHSRTRPWAWAGLALLLLSIPVHAALRIKHWYRLNFPFLEHAAAAADAVSGPQDLFLCNQRAPSVYLYHLRRKGWSWDLQESGEDSLGLVEDRIRQGARFYMTQKSGLFESQEHPFARHFYSRYPVAYDKGDILIFRLAPSSS